MFYTWGDYALCLPNITFLSPMRHSYHHKTENYIEILGRCLLITSQHNYRNKLAYFLICITISKPVLFQDTIQLGASVSRRSHIRTFAIISWPILRNSKYKVEVATNFITFIRISFSENWSVTSNVEGKNTAMQRENCNLCEGYNTDIFTRYQSMMNKLLKLLNVNKFRPAVQVLLWRTFIHTHRQRCRTHFFTISRMGDSERVNPTKFLDLFSSDYDVCSCLHNIPKGVKMQSELISAKLQSITWTTARLVDGSYINK
jgi:hypothetical protein